MKKQNLFLVISMTFVVFLLAIGSGGCLTSPPIEEDFINIISVTPDSGLIDGVDTDFKVVVEYNLFSYDNGKLTIAFSNCEDDPGCHLRIPSAEHYINNGYGTHEFNVIAKPKDWGSEGDFVVCTCIDEEPHIEYPMLDCDQEILTFK